MTAMTANPSLDLTNPASTVLIPEFIDVSQKPVLEGLVVCLEIADTLEQLFDGSVELYLFSG